MSLFKNKLTGKIVERPAHYAAHPVFGKKFVPVDSATPTPSPVKKKSEKTVVEAEVILEPLTSAAETEIAEEIEVNIEEN
jgi:hypothetical protein